MNIFDAHISGSLSVSSSAEISGDLKVLGVVTGSFKGDGSQIQNIPASGVTGLNLTQIADGTATASISQANGFNVNTNINVSGSILPSVNVGENVSTHDLGSATNAWHHLYISTGSIKFVNDEGEEQGRITINPNSGQFNILNTSGLTQSDIDQIELGNVPSSSLSDINIKSLNIYDSIDAGGAITASFISGSFIGNGEGLYNIPASGVTGLNLTQIADGSATASISSINGLRINTDTEITGALTVSGSITLNGVPVGTGKLDESVFNTYTTSINLFSSSIDTTIKNKINVESVISGSGQVLITGTTGYSAFSSSVSDSFNNLSSSVSSSIGSISSSIATTTLGLNTIITNTSSSISTSISDLSGSIATINGTQNNRIGSLEIESGSVRNDFNSYTSSNNSTNITQNNRLTSVESSTGSLNSFTSSINTTIKDKMNSDGVLSGSITFDISTVPGFTGLTESVSGSISSSVNQLSGSLTLTVTNLSSSLTNTDENQNSRITLLETASGSLNSFTSSINTTIKNKLNTEGVISGSIQVDLTNTTNYSNYSASVATTDLGQNNRLSSLEGKTGSYSTTGSNSFIGTQNITGSLYISQNLTVYGSSSLVYVTSSQLAVSSSFISVNVFEPAERFGGLKVYDSGSSAATASIVWDSLNNRWVYQNVDGASYHGAMFIAGPRNSGSLGDEVALTSGRIPKSIGGDHIDNSVMSETNGSIGISGSLVITGSILSTATTLVSGSSQIDHNATTNYDSNKHIDHTAVSITAGSGLTGGGDISSTRTINVGAGNGITVNADDIAIDTSSATFTNGVKSKLNTEVVHSGSYLGTATTANLSENASYLYYTDARVKTKLNAEGVISGSAQVTGIGNSQLTNSSFYVGTTSISLGRGSASQTLTGVSIDGNAATVSGGVYTSGDQTIAGVKTFSSNITNSATADWYMYGFGARGASSGGYGMGLKADIADRTLSMHIPNVAAYSNTGATPKFGWYSNGSVELMTLQSATGNLVVTGTINGLTVSSGTISSGTWNGTAIANAYLANSSFYLGSTSISLGRASATLNLAGVNTDGYAMSLNGYANQTEYTILTGPANGPVIKVRYDSATTNRYIDIGSKDGNGVYSEGLKIYNGGTLTFATYTVYHSGNVPTWNQNTTGTAANITASSNTSLTSLANLATVGTITSGTWNGSSIGTSYTAAKVTAVNAGTGVGVDTTTGSVTVSIGQAVATTSNVTFGSVTGAITSSGNGDGNAPFRFAADYSGWMSIVAGSASGSNGWGLFWAGNDGALYGTNQSGAAGNIWSNSTNPNEFVFVGGGTTVFSVYGNSGHWWSKGNGTVAGTLTVGGSTAKTVANSSYSTTFSSVTSVTVTHNLGTKDVAVFVYDSSDNMFWPSSIVTTSTSVVTVTFASSRSGRVVVVR